MANVVLLTISTLLLVVGLVLLICSTVPDLIKAEGTKYIILIIGSISALIGAIMLFFSCGNFYCGVNSTTRPNVLVY